MPLPVPKWLTVEPALLVYTVAVQISLLVVETLFLQKGCHPEFSQQPDPSLKCENEVGAQQVVTDINAWKPILDSVLTALFITFIGPWGDTHGRRRRPMMIIPIVGEIMTLQLLLMSVYFWNISPQLTALLSVFRSLTGGSICFAAGCLTYISDVTTEEQRTARIGFMGSVALFASPIGISLASFLRMRLNFYGTFIVCIVMHVLALLLTFVLVNNEAVEKNDLKLFEGACSPKNSTELIKTIVKKRENSKRLVLLLMFIVIPLFTASLVGEYSVLNLYARYKFHMEEVQYGYYAAYRRLLISGGLIFTITILCKLLKLSDTVVGMVASVTMIISGVVNSLAENTWQLIVFALLDFMSAAVAITSRSILSKVVDSHEYGKIYSLQGAMESFVPVYAISSFNKFYTLTLDYWPGAFFLIKSFFAFEILIFFASVLYIEIKQRRSQNLITQNSNQSTDES